MDNLSERIRAANPEAAQPLPERVMAGLDDIMAGRRIPQHTAASRERVTHRRWRLAALTGAGLSVVATLAIFAVVLVMVMHPQSAVAATPRPLQLTGTESTVQTLREGVMSVSTSGSGIASTPGATWEGWFLQLDADKPTATYIQPQRTQVEWNPDLSGTSRITAGIPMTPEGTSIHPIPATADEPGTMLYEETWEPGELAVPYPNSPPENAAAMREYLDSFLDEQGLTGGDTATASEYLFAVTALLQVWTLSDAAQRAAVQVLLDAPGVEVAGAATDRAGRNGIVLAVDSTAVDAGYRSQVVIDIERWRILAVERSTIAGIPDFSVPAGSITEYTLWR